jgi:archaellum component FlaF (FlaF/FlaG flagellin family)
MRLSTGSAGYQSSGLSDAPAVSADGRYVAFESAASNLVPGDLNGAMDIFVKDTQTQGISLISTSSAEEQANYHCSGPDISTNGRYVAFVSLADNLVPGDTNGDPDVFVKDTQTGVTTRVSTDSEGNQANPCYYGCYYYNFGSSDPSISADGRYVAFYSYADNLVPGDTNQAPDVFVKDALTGATTRASTDSSWAQASGGNGSAISADGRFVAFNSTDADLVPGGNGAYDVFVKDIQTGSIICASTDSSGGRMSAAMAFTPSLSADGRYVTFDSNSSTLVPGDEAKNCTQDSDYFFRCEEVYLKDTQTGGITRISNDFESGGQPNGLSAHPSITADGGRVTFWSMASNLVPGDTNGTSDVFVWDKNTGASSRISLSAAGGQGNARSQNVGATFVNNSFSSARRTISADGGYVAFESDATNLVPGDGNSQKDIFLASANAAVKKNYWSWYDAQSPGAMNWVLMANANSSVWDLGYGLDIAEQTMDLSPFALTGGGCPSEGCVPGETPMGMAITPSFIGVIGGPVVARSFTDENYLLTSQRTLWGDSLEEVVGTPEERLSDHYYWPWYDSLSPGFTNWVLVSNPNYQPVYYRIMVAGQEAGSGSLNFNESATPNFPGVMSGPVEVEAWSDAIGGSVPARVIASQRVLSDYGGAFNEVPGIPAAELSDHYLWTWYDEKSPGTMDWVLISNPNPAPVNYTVKIAGAELASGTLNAAGPEGFDQVQLRFPGSRGGPVEVSATGTVIASQRTLWGDSFEEVPGFAYSALASSYHWTWYDSSSPGALNWVLVANPNPDPVTYSVRIAGAEVAAGTLEPAGDPNGLDMATPVFDNVMGGPVEVTSSGGAVLASQRVLWKGHFNEVVGTVLD